MEPVEKAIVYAEIESALSDKPSSEPWDEVVQLSITDPRASLWRRYKERLSGAEAELLKPSRTVDSELNEINVGSESLLWKEINVEILRTFNKLFPNINATNLNDKKCDAIGINEIINLYSRLPIHDDVLMENSVLVDVICDPIVKEFSKKIDEVGLCCSNEMLRAKSKTIPVNYLCGKRTDLVGITDWVIKRYGGSRRESSMFVNLVWFISNVMCLTCGNFDSAILMDSAIGVIVGSIMEAISSPDGDRTTYEIDKTELATAAKASAGKSLSTANRIYAGIESVIASRRAYKVGYKELYEKIRCTADPKHIRPKDFLRSRYTDGMCLTFLTIALINDYGSAFDVMTGSIYIEALETACHYNDLSDAVLDMKYMESHNYIICAKSNSFYSFSDHSEALYVALTTFDEPYIHHNATVKRRMCRYRYASIVFSSLWPRYRTSERARRYVSSLSKKERDKLVERGRQCVQGNVHIEENIWLNKICSNFNKRRVEIRNRGYTQTLLCLLGVEEDDDSTKDYIHRAVKANCMLPFDTGLQLVMSLGSVWLARFALRSLTEAECYDNLVTEFADFLNTLSLNCLPIISENVITPCTSIAGPLCLRLNEMLSTVSKINRDSGEGILCTIATVIGMVSLDPFRCMAYQADEILTS